MLEESGEEREGSKRNGNGNVVLELECQWSQVELMAQRHQPLTLQIRPFWVWRWISSDPLHSNIACYGTPLYD